MTNCLPQDEASSYAGQGFVLRRTSLCQPQNTNSSSIEQGPFQLGLLPIRKINKVKGTFFKGKMIVIR